MRRVLLGLLLMVGGVSLSATRADAAFIIDDADRPFTATKNGGSFWNAFLNGISRDVAAEFTNYTQLKVDITRDSGSESDNLGVAWNTDAGGVWAYTAVEASHAWVNFDSNGLTQTITFNYGADTTFANTTAAYAGGAGSEFQVFLQSNWPPYTGSNNYTVTAVYLDGLVPEPASMALLATGAGVTLARRRVA